MCGMCCVCGMYGGYVWWGVGCTGWVCMGRVVRGEAVGGIGYLESCVGERGWGMWGPPQIPLMAQQQ